MVEAIGLQQVLQLSGAVEKAQTAQQTQGSELARGFDRELEKTVERQSSQTQDVKETENAKIREEDQRKQKQYARRLPGPHPDEEEEEDEEDEEPLAETDQGNLINVVA